MRLTFGDMIKKVNVSPLIWTIHFFDVKLIEDLTSEHSEEIKLKAECDVELESEDFK